MLLSFFAASLLAASHRGLDEGRPRFVQGQHACQFDMAGQAGVKRSIFGVSSGNVSGLGAVMSR